jgi:hypothetical protein
MLGRLMVSHSPATMWEARRAIGRVFIGRDCPVISDDMNDKSGRWAADGTRINSSDPLLMAVCTAYGGSCSPQSDHASAGTVRTLKSEEPNLR